MLKRITILILLGFVLLSVIPFSMLHGREARIQTMEARHGVLDLAGWDPDQQEKIKLDGEWEFYWDQLLVPDDFRQASKRLPDAYLTVPGSWNVKTVGAYNLPAYGAATYRLILKHLPDSGIYTLKKTNIRFASTIYVNGRELIEDGTPGLRAESYEAGNIPQSAQVSLERGEVEIIVQVANFDYINSGIPFSLYFGPQAPMDHFLKINLAREFSTLAVLAVLALIFFISYAVAAKYRKKDSSLLLAACICLLFSVYHGLSGERTLTLLLPDLSFEMLYKIKDIVTMGCFIFVALFFYKLQNRIIPLRALLGVIGVLTLFAVAVAVLPIRMYNPYQAYVVLIYQLMSFWLLYKSAAIYINSQQEKQLPSLLLFLSILTINLYSLDTILFALSWKETLWVQQFYLVLFNLIMVVQVVLKFFEAYQTVDRMKNQLIRLDRIKDDFLASTSHELKKPLHAIVNIADTLLKGVEGPVNQTQAWNLNIVLNSGRRLTYLVNELLDYSKMKHGDIRLFRTALNLGDHVAAVIQVHRFLLSGNRIEWVNQIPEDFPPVYADSNRLLQILHQLIGGASQFAEQGDIEIQGEPIGGLVRVTIHIHALGKPVDLPEDLFSSLERLAASGSPLESGAGLGLSVTKQLIELHGGTLYTEFLDRQSLAFVFTLPLADQPVHLDNRLKPSDQGGRLDVEYPQYVSGTGKETILVVENDFANQQSIRNLLKQEGHAVVTVNRGKLALEELAKAHSFFLVILDIALPDLSGYEVLRTLRERLSPVELPVLVLTSRNREDEMRLSVEYGANDFVGMPFESEELLARVRNLIQLKTSVNLAKDAEIAFLRSQINPHFLYNALNSIAELCLEDPEQAEELTVQLSQYLRGSFDFKQLDSLSTLENELKLVAAYVHIEQARFGSRLQVEYEVQADPGLRIPPLVLQPLVENAIRHGVMSKLQGGMVKLAAKELPDTGVYFYVMDDGVGIREDKLEELRGRDTNRKGVGLWNISQRLRLLYGEDLQIASTPGQGTTISFLIPAVRSSVGTGGITHAANHDRG
ncbi:ATP-binding protein [Paenibacillus rubinfantis]|uniref:ATP-binding protein n=1 Tax=Paenibacillus rubinfantis TaxID=1720296 RepID=UPI00073EC4A3|nr:ATP-binding protein [Paenibacillus rubinfantis]